MDLPTRSTLPLWPLPLLAALLPLLVAHLAWWLSMRDGLIPVCNPYCDGCVSISRAARHGLGNQLFRMVMLPCAVVQVMCWIAATLWLRRETGSAVRVLPWLGLVAGVFLALYAAFLGSEGRIYELLRRHGIQMYFGCTYLALLVVLRTLSGQSVPSPAYRPLFAVAWGFMALGLTSIAVSYMVDDPQSRDRQTPSCLEGGLTNQRAITMLPANGDWPCGHSGGGRGDRPGRPSRAPGRCCRP